MVNRLLISRRLGLFLITGLLLLCGSGQLSVGQGNGFNYFYRVIFKDKGDYITTGFKPSDLLSERAIERRTRTGTEFPVMSDLPVNWGYINEIKALGYTLHCTSRWMNSGLFKSAVRMNKDDLLLFPFVREVKEVKHPSAKNTVSDKFFPENESESSLSESIPLSMLNVLSLHDSGFNGEGILIAVLDAGFYNADNISSIENLRNRDGIMATYNIVDGSNGVYGFHDHGTAVLSILAGNLPDFLEGSAPGADYLLFRTEDAATEFPVEEDFWVAGAEMADSIGADIISSSLGYFNFDDPLLDYKFSDMDGNNTFVTRAADIAASKGILVVNSAGNERDNSWLRIIAPSDGDSVLAVGAVDRDKKISGFSSAGPSADGRVKPDVSAQGVSVPLQTETTFVRSGSGTSFSCPLISGISACLMQAIPVASNYDIIEALRITSDRYQTPDSLYGFGIPDAEKALAFLQAKLSPLPETGSVVAPNPFSDRLTVIFKEIPGVLKLEIFDLNGNLVFSGSYNNYVSRSITLYNPVPSVNGVYFLRIRTQDHIFSHKLIRFSE